MISYDNVMLMTYIPLSEKAEHNSVSWAHKNTSALEKKGKDAKMLTVAIYAWSDYGDLEKKTLKKKIKIPQGVCITLKIWKVSIWIIKYIPSENVKLLKKWGRKRKFSYSYRILI